MLFETKLGGFRIRLLSASILAGVSVLAAVPAEAACTTSGTTTTCDSSPPNPTQGPITGGNVRLLNGAIIEDNNVPNSTTPTIRIDPGGSLIADAGSLVRDDRVSSEAIRILASPATISGTVTRTSVPPVVANASAVHVVNGANLVVSQSGLIEHSGSGNAATASSAITASGSRSSVQVNGTVRATGPGSTAIQPTQSDGFGSLTFTALDITVGSTGLVETTGSDSDAIAATSATNVIVGGRVIARGLRSDGIDLTYGATTAGGTLTVLEGGSVVSEQAVGIRVGQRTAVTIHGHVGGAVNALLAPNGSGPIDVTVSTTATVAGSLTASDHGLDRLNYVAADDARSNGQLAAASGFELLRILSGNWTAAAPAGSYTNTQIAQGATLEVRNPGGAATLQSRSIELAGNLLLNFTTDASVLFDNDPNTNPLGANSISGTGGIVLTGPATVTLGGEALQYTGQTMVQNGRLILVGRLPGGLTIGAGTSATVANTTAGFSIASLGNAGAFSYDRNFDGTILGQVSGPGTFTKNGNSVLSVLGNYANRGATVINAGTLRLAGGVDPALGFTVDQGTLEFANTASTISSLRGAAGGTVRITDTNLTLNQSADTTFAGRLAGNGAFVKTGTGRLTLSGASSLTGTTTLANGILTVTGSLAGPASVTDGRLEGTGSISGLTVGQGIVAPGTGIGTLTVNGPVGFGAGSIFEVEANAAGQADRIAATGIATLSGGTVRVLAQAGTYNPATQYTILTASGVSGQFAAVTSNLAFLTPGLVYGPTSVQLILARNDIAFGDAAETPNQAAAAGAAQALPITDPISVALLQSSQAGAPELLQALSGEFHASLPVFLAQDQRLIRDALLAQGARLPDGLSLWARGFAGRAEAEGGAGITAARGRREGFLAGFGYAGNGLSAAIGAGLGEGRYRLDDRQSRADANSTFVAAHIGYSAGGFALQAGGSHSWHDIDSERSLPAAALGAPAGGFDGRSTQLFAEAAYSLLDGPVRLTPFLGYDWVRATTDAFTETGGAAALAVERGRFETDHLSAGIRFAGAFPAGQGATLRPRATLAYRHRLGDGEGDSTVRFVSGGPAFAVEGVRLPDNSIDADVGVELETGRFRLGASYRRSFADLWEDEGAFLSLSIRL
jgi:fibronectin-binding autotransporter adhesin